MNNCAYPEQASFFSKLAVELNTSIPGETPSALVKRIKQKRVNLDKFFQNTDGMSEFRLPLPGFKQPKVRKMLDDLRGNPDYYLDQLKAVPDFLLEKAVQQNPRAFEGVNAQGITGNIGKMAGHSTMGLTGGIYKEAWFNPLVGPIIQKALVKWLPAIANGVLDTTALLHLGGSQLGDHLDIDSANDKLRQWGSGGDLDSFFAEAEQRGIQELKNPLVQAWIRTDPKGAFDYIARAAEAKGAKLYEPPAAGADLGTTLQYFGNQNPNLRDFTGNLSRFTRPFNESGKIFSGGAREWLSKDVLGAVPAAAGLSKNYLNLINESRKQHYRRLADDPQYFSDNFSTPTFGNLLDSVGMSRSPILTKQKGYKSPGQILSEMFERTKSDVKKVPGGLREVAQKFKSGDRKGAIADTFGKGFRAFSRYVEANPLAAAFNATVSRPYDTGMKNVADVLTDTQTQRNYALGYLGNQNRGASDSIGYAVLRKLQGMPNPEGYKGVREHAADLTDAGKTWGANFLNDPLTGVANAWKNPYGRTVILGAGGLAALVGGKSIMDRMAADKKKREEEEALRTGFRTKGIHRYGAY